jgi:hypothetical protein
MTRLPHYALGATLVVLALTGCTDLQYTETRQHTEDRIVFQPKQANGYDSLAPTLTPANPGAQSLGFTINQLTPGAQYRQSVVITETRTNWHSAAASSGVGAVILAPVFLVGCATDDDRNCFTPKYGEWSKTSETNSGPPVATGHSEVRSLPLAGTFAGSLSVIGLDAADHPIGHKDGAYTFAATNSIDLTSLVSGFRRRPDHLMIRGSFTTPKGDENIEMLAVAPVVAQLSFGQYAWKTPAEIQIMKQIETVQQQIAAAQGAAAAAAAEQQRLTEEAEEAANTPAESSDTDKDEAAMAGMVIGGLVAQNGGNAATASQMASLAGADPDAASAGAGMVQQQQQQLQVRAAQMQAQSSAIADARQQQLAAQAQLQQAHAVQVAYQQQLEQQEAAAAQQQREQEAQERATQQRAFATQCLSVRQNSIEQGNPSLSIRDSQHFVIHNSCSDDVWAFITDNAGNGQGGDVPPSQDREFVFFNKGHGWMKEFRGCISKYDVDHQCEGDAQGLGGY